MIANPDCRCACCLSFATRATVDEWGETLILCDRCPSPSEIDLRTAEIRENWDEIEHWCRRYGLPREAAFDGRNLRVREISIVPPHAPVSRTRSFAASEV